MPLFLCWNSLFKLFNLFAISISLFHVHTQAMCVFINTFAQSSNRLARELNTINTCTTNTGSCRNTASLSQHKHTYTHAFIRKRAHTHIYMRTHIPQMSVWYCIVNIDVSIAKFLTHFIAIKMPTLNYITVRDKTDIAIQSYETKTLIEKSRGKKSESENPKEKPVSGPMNWIFYFFFFFFLWISAYHSTTKQFSHWNWNTKRTIHNSVRTVAELCAVLMCGVFVSLFFFSLYDIVIIQNIRTRVHAYKHENYTHKCTHSQMSANKFIYMHTRTRTHTYYIYIKENLFCGPRIELSMYILDRSVCIE